MLGRARRRCLPVLIGLGGIASSFAQPVPTSQPATIDRDEFATNVWRVYRTATYLKFKMEVAAEPYRLQAEVEMAPRRLLTHVRQNGETFAVVGLSGGICWEYRPRWKDTGDRIIRDARVEYEAPEPSGSGNMVLGEHEDCLYGTLLRTWVGRSGDSVTGTFGERIRAADTIESGEAGGAACWVVSKREEQFKGYFEQRYWFDQKSCLLRRWETRDVEDGKLTVRNREYSKIEVREAVPDGAFADEARYRSPSERPSGIAALRTPIRIGALPRLKPW